MTADELLKCVNKLVPDAICSVCQDHPLSAPYIKWDEANTKPMPTMKECEAILPTVQAEEKTVTDAEQARKKLSEIDLKSIRSIREWVAKQADAPQFIKDFESQATIERAKLK
jgi:hypothetical protein